MLRYTLTWLYAKLHLDERGQDLMEYALLGGFIAVVFAVAAIALPLGTFFNTMVGAIGECADMDATCP